MTKLHIEGKHFSYSILEFHKVDAMYFDFIITNKPQFLGKIPFEHLDLKKLENPTVISQFSGFFSAWLGYGEPVGIFTMSRNQKKVFAGTLDRLEMGYHVGLYPELCEINSTFNSFKLKFKKRTGYKYYLLKEERDGVYLAQYKGNVTIKQLVFHHSIIENNGRVEKYMNVQKDDRIIEFAVGGNPEVKRWLEIIR